MPETPTTVRDLRRAQILAAARQLIAEGGIEALTFGTLEQRLAFTRGVITYHFRDKSDILAAALQSAIAELDRATFARVDAHADFPGKVHAALHTKVVGFLESAEARAILISFWSRLGSDPESAALNARFFASWRHQAAHLVRQGQESGEIEFGVDIPALATLLVGAVLGIVLQRTFSPDGVDVEACVAASAAQFLHACGYRGEHAPVGGGAGAQPARSQPEGATNAPSSGSAQP